MAKRDDRQVETEAERCGETEKWGGGGRVTGGWERDERQVRAQESHPSSGGRVRGGGTHGARERQDRLRQLSTRSCCVGEFGVGVCGGAVL